jgi:hypothetical protein
VLRRVSGPKGEKVTGVWRKQHNEELPKIFSSANSIRKMKSRWMGWADM